MCILHQDAELIRILLTLIRGMSMYDLLQALTDEVQLTRLCGDDSDKLADEALQAMYDMYGE